MKIEKAYRKASKKFDTRCEHIARKVRNGKMSSIRAKAVVDSLYKDYLAVAVEYQRTF